MKLAAFGLFIVAFVTRCLAMQVVFDAALTNASGWVYSDKVRLYSASSGGNVRLASDGAEVRSPQFPCLVKSVVLHGYYPNASKARPVALLPMVDGAVRAFAGWNVSDGSGVVASNHEWAVEERVSGFVVRSGKDAGNGSFSLQGAEVEFYDEASDVPVTDEGAASLAVLPNLPRGRFLYSLDPSAPEGWQVYRALDAVTAIGASDGGATKGGAYVWRPTNGAVGFGTLSASAVTWMWGVAFENRATRAARAMRLRVGAGQWGARNLNAIGDSLAIEWQVSSSARSVRDGGAWQAASEPLFVASVTGGDEGVEFPVLDDVREFAIPGRLEPGERLLIRFVDASPAKGGNAAMGLWLFEFSCEVAPPLRVSVR